MARDKALVRRNLLAIPGAILTFYMLVGLAYVLAYRGDGGVCRANDLVLVAGKCYHVLPFLTAGLILGAGLLAASAAWFRALPAYAVDRLRPGTPTHVAVAILASLVVVLGLFAAVMAYLEGLQSSVFSTTWGGYRFQTRFLLLLGAAAALALLATLLAALGAERLRRRAFLRAARDEGEEPEPVGLPPAEPQDRHPPEEFVDEAQWPSGREGEPEPAPAATEPAAAPPAPPAPEPAPTPEPARPEPAPQNR